MKKFILLFVFVAALKANAQQYSLYNTHTLFDTFENPAQKAFKADTSRKYAFNFFIPNFGLNLAAAGDAQFTIRTLVAKQAYTGQQLPIGQNNVNTLLINDNTYLAMFRIFKSVKFNREMGLSWQIRSDTWLDVTNETLAIFDSYQLFSGNNYPGLLNNKGYSQNYHQFSFTYREDYNKRLGLGVKLSYISGMAYNDLKVDSSLLAINRTAKSYNLFLDGRFRSNFQYDNADKNILVPGLKNPGFAITASATYKPRGGWFILGNLKDIGFIKWSNESYVYSFKEGIQINNASSRNADFRLRRAIDSVVTTNYTQKGFTTLLNGKAEVLINKNFGNYQPNVLISKNLFYKGADIGMMNNYSFGKLNLGLSTVYNTAKIFQVGGSVMFKSPDFEFFLGTDQLFKTYSTIKSISKSDNTVGSGYTGGSFYLGLAVKFGPTMEHPLNANSIPGFERADADDRPGFFKRLFSKR